MKLFRFGLLINYIKYILVFVKWGRYGYMFYENSLVVKMLNIERVKIFRS